MEKKEVRVVKILPDGSLTLNGAGLSMAELESRLTAARARDPEMSMAIAGDPQVNYAKVVDIIDMAGRLSITNVGLVTAKIGV